MAAAVHTTQEEIVNTFCKFLTRCDYDRAKDYMERERLRYINRTWPRTMFDILCDFALAEKNYSETNFEPAKNRMLERKEDENYLDFVYKTLFLDLEKLQTEVEDLYLSNLISALQQYISVRIELLHFYDKLYEIGKENGVIDFGELARCIESIQKEFADISPIAGALKILKYELEGLKCLLECHEQIEKWSFLNAVYKLKKGCDAVSSWEESCMSKEHWQLRSIIMTNYIFPALITWYKKFKHLTLEKFTLYFYGILYGPTIAHHMRHLCSSGKLFFFENMQQLQKKMEAQCVMLVLDRTKFTKPSVNSDCVCPEKNVDGHLCVKYQIMVPINHDAFEKIIPENNDKEDSMNQIGIVNFKDDTYLLMRVDLAVTLIMPYKCSSKSEERDIASINDFVIQLRCHSLFCSVNE